MRTDLALNILKLILLGLLYLFFARVLWTVWQEVRTDRRVVPSHIANERSETRPAPVPKRAEGEEGPARTRRPAGDPRAQGAPRRHVRARRNEITIGRDPGCTIQIEGDTFVSQRHARVFLVDGQPMVEDLGSTNGSFHNGNRLNGSRLLHPGDRVQVGYTVMEAQ